MKKSLLLFFALFPMFLYAGVIMKQSGERLEDVTIKSVTNTEIIYVINGTESTLSKSEVSAILYDDGRYEEIMQNANIQEMPTGGDDFSNSSVQWKTNGDVREYTVYAYGNYIMKFYVADHKYDGAKVEYRVWYKGQKEEPEWTYLGTAPFVYATAAAKNGLLQKEAREMAEINPLIVDNPKSIKKVEFRLSKEGYKTVVVSPLIQIDFTGFFYFISLNKLKPLKDGNEDETDIRMTDTPKSGKNESTQKTVEPVYEQTVASEPVYNEPTHEEPIYETPIPKQQKASKSSPRHEEPVYEHAVEVAPQEKEEGTVVQTHITVNEEPQITAVEEPEMIFKADKKYLSFSEEGGVQQIHVDASSPWEIYSSPDWTEVRKSSGTLTVNCSANAQFSDREEDLILRNKQGQKILIIIAQDKNADFLNLSANIVYENDGDGGRYIIHVRTNKPYQASATAQWCHVNISADSLILSVDENRSGNERQCEAEVRVSEQLKQTIYVKQAPLQHYVHVSPQIVTATQRGGTISIQVDSDEKWRVVNIPEWCQVSEQTNDSFLLEILPNDTGVSRTEVFSVSAYGTRQNITVKQE